MAGRRFDPRLNVEPAAQSNQFSPFAPPYDLSDTVLPRTDDYRTLTLAFQGKGVSGNNQVSSELLSDGTQQLRHQVDAERCYEVKLARILITGLDSSKVTSGLHSAINMRLKGASLLPQPQGYGMGVEYEYVTLMGPDWTATVPQPVEFKELYLSSDVDGRIKFGAHPTLDLRDVSSGESVDYSYAIVQLNLLTKHPQTTQAGGH